MARVRKMVKIKSRKGSRTKKVPSLIRLNAKKNNKRRNQHYSRVKTVVSIIAIVALIGLFIGLWVGSRLIVRRLYSRNSTFVIKHININGSLMLSPLLVREYTQIDEGLNLFDINIKQIRNDFLRRVPSVKSMDISRKLPDRLVINIVERIPLAKLGSGPLVVDRYGMIFVFKGSTSQLPIILGYDKKRSRPGVKILGIAQAALEALCAIDEDPSLGLDVAKVVVSKGAYLLLRLTDGKVIKLTWDEMGMQTRVSQEKLLMKLSEISSILHSRRGMNLITLDATVDNNMPGKYVNR